MTICEFVVIFMYLTRNCIVYVNKIYVLFCSVPFNNLPTFVLKQYISYILYFEGCPLDGFRDEELIYTPRRGIVRKKQHRLQINITVKPVLSSHSKEDRFVFKTGNRFMQVESIAECSRAAFCNTFDLH